MDPDPSDQTNSTGGNSTDAAGHHSGDATKHYPPLETHHIVVYIILLVVIVTCFLFLVQYQDDERPIREILKDWKTNIRQFFKKIKDFFFPPPFVPEVPDDDGMLKSE